MGDTTPVYGIPYPEPTDQVMDGADNMRDIAEALEAILVAMPRGRVASDDLGADLDNGTGTLDALTFTEDTVAGRRYRLSSCVAVVTDPGEFVEHRLRIDGVTRQIGYSAAHSAGAPITGTPFVELGDLAAGSHVFVLQLASSGGVVVAKASATVPATFLLEDIGPV